MHATIKKRSVGSFSWRSLSRIKPEMWRWPPVLQISLTSHSDAFVIRPVKDWNDQSASPDVRLICANWRREWSCEEELGSGESRDRVYLTAHPLSSGISHQLFLFSSSTRALLNYLSNRIRSRRCWRALLSPFSLVLKCKAAFLWKGWMTIMQSLFS